MFVLKMLAKFILLDLLFSVISDSDPLILTRYIQLNKLDEARNLSAVTNLPNAQQFESYSGYFTVNKEYNSNLFYWFLPAINKPESAPLIIYLEGGPGTSSIASLLLFGPLKVEKNMKLSLNPNSWTQEYSMLYIDNPVGTGFSFTDDPNGFSTDQNSVADNLYEFLQQFYTIYHEYRKNDLYIAGLSYAGKYVPALGYKLMQMSHKSNINFKGVAIGNGLTDGLTQMNYSMLFKSLGLIDEKQFHDLRRVEQNVKTAIRENNFTRAIENGFEIISTEGIVAKYTGFGSFYDISRSGDFEKIFPMDYLTKYLNQATTQKALHTKRITYSPMSSEVYEKLVLDVLKSVEHNLTALIGNYKVLLFTGNFDIIVGVTSTAGLLENPGWKYYNDYYQANRTIWRVNSTDQEVAGYTKSFNNFTHVIIRNSGHCTPCDQPRATFDMLKRFIQSKSFENQNLS